MNTNDIKQAIERTRLEDWPANGSKESILMNLTEALESAEQGDFDLACDWVASAYERNIKHAFNSQPAIFQLHKKYN